MANHPRWRRRKILVNNKLQFRFTALLLLQMSIILAVLAVLVYSHVNRTAEIALSVPFLDGPARLQLQHEFIDNVQGFYGRSIVLMAITATTIVLFGLFASHKIAGPAIKLQTYLNAVTGGDFSQRISFRRDDNLDDFACHVNQVADAIEGRRNRAQEIASELARRSGELEDSNERERFLAEAEHLIAEYKATI
jgi:methyl-accepting chemotaxis protein